MNSSKKQSHYKAILFDIDGTLLAATHIGRPFVIQTLIDICAKAPSLENYDMSGKTDWSIFMDLMQLCGLSFEEAQAHLKLAFKKFAQYLTESKPTLNGRALPGVHDLLVTLSNNNDVLLGLLTGNIHEIVIPKLESAGIDPAMFSFGVYGNEHPQRDELAKKAFNKVVERLGEDIKTDDVLVIGDTHRDITCARSAGMHVLAVATGFMTYDELGVFKPDYLLNDLKDTKSVLNIIYKRNYIS